jgi:hypothetical protein
MNHPSNSSLFEVYLPDGLAENISTIGPSANSIRVPQPLIPLRSPFSEEYRPALQRRPARCTSGFILCFCFPLTPMVDNSRDRQPAGGETPSPPYLLLLYPDHILGCTQWIPLRSNDGSLVLYFDPQTKQVWGADSGADPNSGMNIDEDIRPGEASGSNARTFQEDHPMGECLDDDDIEMAIRIARMVSLRSTINRHGQLKSKAPARRPCDMRTPDDAGHYLPIPTIHRFLSHHRITSNGHPALGVSEPAQSPG